MTMDSLSFLFLGLNQDAEPTKENLVTQSVGRKSCRALRGTQDKEGMDGLGGG